MVYGTHPFEGKENDVVAKIINDKVPFPKNIKITNSCKNLILRLLEKDPTKRIDLYEEGFDEWYNEETHEENAILVNYIEEEKVEKITTSHTHGTHGTHAINPGLNINNFDHSKFHRISLKSKTLLNSPETTKDKHDKQNNKKKSDRSNMVKVVVSEPKEKVVSEPKEKVVSEPKEKIEHSKKK